MTKERHKQLMSQEGYWNLKKGDIAYRLTHNEMCLGYHWCYDYKVYSSKILGPGIPGWNPKCDCDPYDETSEHWDPKAIDPYVVMIKDGQRPPH